MTDKLDFEWEAYEENGVQVRFLNKIAITGEQLTGHLLLKLKQACQAIDELRGENAKLKLQVDGLYSEDRIKLLAAFNNLKSS